jgi:hypothetical protein
VPYYGPRFQPTETPSFWDQLSGVVQQGASGYTLGRALKQEQEDRAERKRQQERREGREDWEWGIVPEGEEPAPRETATYPNTPVPPDTLPALGGGRSSSTVGDFLEVDEGFQPRRPMGPELEDEGFMPRPRIGPDVQDQGFLPQSRGPRREGGIIPESTGGAPGPSIADFLGDEPLQDIQPRRYPGMDPYTVGGRTYDPEIPLRRGLTGRRAELTLADEMDEARTGRVGARERAETDRARQQKIDAMIEAGVDPKRAAAIVDSGAEERELFPDQFRTSWPTPREGEERIPRPTIDRAINSILQLYGTWNDKSEVYDPPPGIDLLSWQSWVEQAASALQRGDPIPPMPSGPAFMGGEEGAPNAFTRTGRGMGGARGKRPVSQDEYDDIVAEVGADFARAHYQVMR